jgi:hypothetical protein
MRHLPSSCPPMHRNQMKNVSRRFPEILMVFPAGDAGRSLARLHTSQGGYGNRTVPEHAPERERSPMLGKHAVVTPIAATGECCDGQQLQCRDAELDQVIKLLRHAIEGPGQRERAHVQLVENCRRPRSSGPIIHTPAIRAWIDQLARSCDAVRWKCEAGSGTRAPSGSTYW